MWLKNFRVKLDEIADGFNLRASTIRSHSPDNLVVPLLTPAHYYVCFLGSKNLPFFRQHFLSFIFSNMALNLMSAKRKRTTLWSPF